ncbi:excalibur calcium-binding domain-containing protein [Demequina sp.]|uniref:excalibur calcium-binding domain-containing protein n=1 Tax=Demequina sp. TaxID=2050685 RepID=UPI003D112C83
MTTRRTFRAVAAATTAAFLLAGAGLSAASAAPAGTHELVPTKTYANCTALKKVYPGGVAKSKSTVNKVNGKKKNGLKKNTKVSATLYAQNSKMDRDKDGWACE